ncbi:MAG: hypothetical protein ACTSRQ_01250 [Candidatus Thorarchaeota archaeon]
MSSHASPSLEGAEVLSFLYRDGEVPSIGHKIRKNKRKVIIVTGADFLRDATPSSHREKFSELLDHLLSSLPDDENTTIVWFDSPAPSVEKSIPYSTRALIPYYETSPLGEMVTEIIWNLPIAPRSAVQPEKWKLSTIGDAPMYDDIRAIIRHSPTDLRMELIHVPFLRGWSKRFRNKGSGRIIREQEVNDIVPEKTTRDRMKVLSMTMLPWLVRLLPHLTLVNDSNETLEEQIAHLEVEYRGGTESLKFTPTVLPDTHTKPPSLLDLVRFRLPATMDALSYQKMTAGRINSQRLYRSPRKLQTQPLQRVPSPLPTQEAPTIKEEPEYEWLFGAKFESENEDIQSWWMVVQDPTRSSRMLAGCFIDKPPDKNGFLWAEKKQEILTQASLDEILSFSQTVMIGRRIEENLELWMSSDGDEPVYAGVFEVKEQGRSTTGNLRAICLTFTKEPAVRPSLDLRPSESFYRRIVESLRRQIAVVTNSTPAKIHLEMVDDVCQVTLQDDEGNLIQEVSIEYTADLISLLRWPMTKGGPMFTDSGEHVTWSIFDDIDYGELDFISPYVTYTAARKSPSELPKRVTQFFEEAETIAMGIEHDHSVCPMVTDTERVDHGECWRVTFPSDCPEPVRRQLGRAMSGEELNGLLAPERLFAAGKLYILKVSQPEVSEKDESVVFHEDKFIRIFLREMGQPLKPILPGTYLRVVDQEWYIYITWRGEKHLEWTAQSTVSGLYARDSRGTIELKHGHGIKKECARILELITSRVPNNRVKNLSQVEETVLSGFRSRGYSSKSSRPCELRVLKSTKSVFSFCVIPVGGGLDEDYVDITIEADCGGSPDNVLNEIDNSFNEGDLSHYNFRNKKSFWNRLSAWVERNIPDVELLVEEEVEGEQEYIESEYEEGLEPDYEERLEEEEQEDEV